MIKLKLGFKINMSILLRQNTVWTKCWNGLMKMILISSQQFLVVTFEPTDFNNMFKKTSTGDRVTRIIAQILMLFSTYGSEGGLFIMIGRKRPTTK